MSFTQLEAAKIDTSTICKIIAYDYNGYNKTLYAGTGFIYHQDEENYYIMTNGHTLKNARAGIAASFYKDEYMTSLVNCELIRSFYQIGTSKDVAVLAIKKSDLPYKITPLKLNYNKVPVKKVVFGSGYPNGFWQQEWSGRVLPDNYERITVVNMPSLNGQSGSPVMVDIDGENYVVGMITYRFNNGVEPAQATGGYIDMDYIYDVILDKTDQYDTVLAKVGNAIAPAVMSDAYIIVDIHNKIRVYDDINGIKYPIVYTYAETKRAELPNYLAFCPYDEHPIKEHYPILDRLPTINKPKKPWLPPFNKPAVPDNQQPQPAPKVKPDNFWPGGAPDLAPEAEKPDNKPKPEDELKSEFKKLEDQYKSMLDKIEKSKEEQKRLSHEALEAERKVWEKRQQESERAKSVLEGKLAGLESKLSQLTAVQAEKPKAVTTDAQQQGFLGKVIGGITMIPSKIGSLFSTIGNNVTSDGIFWTIIATAGGMFIPGVRSALIARGVSPILLKIGGWAIRSGGFLRKFKKKVNSIEDDIETKTGISKEDIENIINKGKNIINFPNVGAGPFQGVDSNGNPVPMQNDSIELPSFPSANIQTPVPFPEYNNVQLADAYSEESLKNFQNPVNSEAKPQYNEVSKEVTEPAQLYVNKGIKEVVDKQMQATKTSLQELSYIGHLYKEGVEKLKNNELKDVNGAPVQSCKESADAVEKWVKQAFVSKVTQSVARKIENSDYLFAYRGMLYKEAVRLLGQGWFSGVTNYATAADAVERWVENLLFEKLTRNI